MISVCVCLFDVLFFFTSDQNEIYIGDDNPLTLKVTAENGGEGAYEADLIITLPSQADFTAVVRNSEVRSDPCATNKV